MGKLVLVTGGSGFIGSNLQERLVELGYRVVNIDIKKPKNNDVFTFYSTKRYPKELELLLLNYIK